MSLTWEGIHTFPPFLRFAQPSCLCGKTKHSLGMACVQCSARLDECCMEKREARKCSRCNHLFCGTHLQYREQWEHTSIFDGPMKLDGGRTLGAHGWFCEDCCGLMLDEQYERADQRARAILRRVIPMVDSDVAASFLRHAEAFLASDRAGEVAERERQLRKSERMPTTREMYAEAYAGGKRGA